MRLKTIAILSGVLVLALLLSYFIIDEHTPTGTPGEQAEEMAQKMLRAVNKTAWDNTEGVQFTFKDANHYRWDRAREFCEVKWGENMRVLLRLKDWSKSIAYQNGQQLTGDEAYQANEKAWKMFINDTFWLNAPAKVLDEGTSRSIVTRNDRPDKLLVSYSSGGVTPGDSYLWELSEEGLPVSWQMWVKIIPVGGMRFTWENWEQLQTGALIATHHGGPIEIDITNLKGTATFDALLSGEPDPFIELL